MEYAISLFISLEPFHLSFKVGLFVLTMIFSSTQSCNILVADESLAYLTCWGAWRNIGVKSGLALIPLVMRPLPSPQKTSLMECAAPPFISPESSHLSSDIRLFILTVTLSSISHYVDIQQNDKGY
uniref:Uncharacterized protein n=1 Tax=Opuntia streptacantha TaxID=393608 RepID=A0A7C9EWH8_OPUST